MEEVLEQHAAEIYPGLWLGDIQSATDNNFITAKNITCIINCTVTLPFSDLDLIRYRYRIPVKDNQQPDQIYLMYTLLDKAVKLIIKHLPKNNILVHCYAGRQRSVSVIIAFFMKCAEMSKNDAFQALQSKRIVAGTPYFNFDKALVEYEKNLMELREK